MLFNRLKKTLAFSCLLLRLLQATIDSNFVMLLLSHKLPPWLPDGLPPAACTERKRACRLIILANKYWQIALHLSHGQPEILAFQKYKSFPNSHKSPFLQARGYSTSFVGANLLIVAAQVLQLRVASNWNRFI